VTIRSRRAVLKFAKPPVRYANGVARDHGDVELLPNAGSLVVRHTTKVLGEIEGRCNGKLFRRGNENAAAVCEENLVFG
jgi:hypothetical protein